MKSLDKLLDELKGKALEEIRDEFKSLLNDSKKDSKEYIQNSAKDVIRWLELLANGDLTESDVKTLFKKQKKVAQVYANSQTIIVRSRVQKLTYRILDIAIDVLTGALA